MTLRPLDEPGRYSRLDVLLVAFGLSSALWALSEIAGWELHSGLRPAPRAPDCLCSEEKGAMR